MATDAAGLARKIGKVAKVGPEAMEASVRKGAKIIQAEALKYVGTVTHGTFKLRGVRARNTGAEAKVGVRMKIIGTGKDTTAVVRATGPWQFIENRVEPHPVGIRAEARGESPVMMVPGAGGLEFRVGPWIAGGGGNKHPWKLSKVRSKPIVEKQFEREVLGRIRTNF